MVRQLLGKREDVQLQLEGGLVDLLGLGEPSLNFSMQRFIAAGSRR